MDQLPSGVDYARGNQKKKPCTLLITRDHVRRYWNSAPVLMAARDLPRIHVRGRGRGRERVAERRRSSSARSYAYALGEVLSLLRLLLPRVTRRAGIAVVGRGRGASEWASFWW